MFDGCVERIAFQSTNHLLNNPSFIHDMFQKRQNSDNKKTMTNDGDGDDDESARWVIEVMRVETMAFPTF